MISHEWGKGQNVFFCETDIPQRFTKSWWQLLNRRSYAFNFTTRKPSFRSFLVSSDLYNGNHDRHGTPSTIISYQMRYAYITSCVWNFRTWVILPSDDHNLYLILIIAHILLRFIIRTVRLLETSCCLSHLACQLTLINIFILPFVQSKYSQI